MKLGQTLAGLLNATFGNAVEIIVGISALLQGHCFLLFHVSPVHYAHLGDLIDQIQIVQTSVLIVSHCNGSLGSTDADAEHV